MGNLISATAAASRLGVPLPEFRAILLLRDVGVGVAGRTWVIDEDDLVALNRDVEKMRQKRSLLGSGQRIGRTSD